MTRIPIRLDPELTWQGDGCLTDVALHALADGEQDLVPGAAEHAAACSSCHTKLGETVLLALELAEALGDGPLSDASALGIARPWPWRALLCAVLVAAVSVTPGLAGFFTQLMAMPTSHGQAFALLARWIARMGALATWLRGQHALELAATLVFASVGALIARFAPRSVQRPGVA